MLNIDSNLLSGALQPLNTSPAQTQKMEALLKAEVTVLPQQPASSAESTALLALLCG